MSISEPKGIQVETRSKKDQIEADFQAVIDKGKDSGIEFTKIIIHRDKAI